MPRKRLTHLAVIAAAADLVNTDGAEALSLARLAARLDIRTPSLYNHVDGLSGLMNELERLNAQRLGERLGNAVMGRSGMEALNALALAYRNYARENPGLYAIGLRSVANDDASNPASGELQTAQERVVQVVMCVIESFGLSGLDALHAVRGLRSLVHGFTSIEMAGGFGLPLDLEESYRRMIAAFGRGISENHLDTRI